LEDCFNSIVAGNICQISGVIPDKKIKCFDKSKDEGQYASEISAQGTELERERRVVKKGRKATLRSRVFLMPHGNDAISFDSVPVRL
jgi:hypothetical protein